MVFLGVGVWEPAGVSGVGPAGVRGLSEGEPGGRWNQGPVGVGLGAGLWRGFGFH